MNSAIMGTASSGQPARLSSKYNASFQARVHSKAGSLGKDSLADRKRMITAGINGSNLPNMKKTPALDPSSNSRKLQPSVQSKRPQTSVPGQRCNNRLADGPHWAGGWSARGDVQIFTTLWDPPVISSSFLYSLRPETSGARLLASTSPPPLDLPPPAILPRFLA